MRAHEFITEGAKHLGQYTIDLIKLAWDDGLSPADIANELNLKISTVNNVLRKYYPDRPNKTKFITVTQDLIDSVKANRDNGKTAKESADELGLSVQQVIGILKRYYADRDKLTPLDQDTIDLVKLSWDEGKTKKEIAADLGLNKVTVGNILHKYYRERPNKTGPAEEKTIELVKAAWDQGRTPTEIAKILNLKDRAVDNILLKYYPNRDNKIVQWSLALSDNDRAQIVSDFLNGKPVLALAKEYGISTAGTERTIKQQIGDENYRREIEKRKNTPGVRARDKLSSTQLNKIRDMYANGVTLADIVTYFDGVVSQATIERNMLKQPDYAELRAKRDERKRKIDTGTVTTTKIHRAGTIDNQRSKGPGSRHTSGVDWPKYGE